MCAAAITGLSALARGPKAVAKVMRPKSVAIIGMSARPGSAGQNILNGLKANEFKGDIYLVGRNPEPIDGRKLLASPLDFTRGRRPGGIYLACGRGEGSGGAMCATQGGGRAGVRRGIRRDRPA